MHPSAINNTHGHTQTSKQNSPVDLSLPQLHLLRIGIPSPLPTHGEAEQQADLHCSVAGEIQTAAETQRNERRKGTAAGILSWGEAKLECSVCPTRVVRPSRSSSSIQAYPWSSTIVLARRPWWSHRLAGPRDLTVNGLVAQSDDFTPPGVWQRTRCGHHSSPVVIQTSGPTSSSPRLSFFSFGRC